MIKFIFGLLFCIFIYPIISEGFWLIRGVLIHFILALLISNLYYFDHLILNLDFMFDIISISLVVLSL